MEVGKTMKIDGGIIVTVEALYKGCCEISGSFGKYSFIAAVFDEKSHGGLMGSRLVSLTMWRTKKTLIGASRILPVVCCDYVRWKVRPHADMTTYTAFRLYR